MKLPIFFLPINYPNQEEFFKLLDILAANHAEYVEVGIPVKVPYMDGQLITQAGASVLKRGLSFEMISAILKKIRARYGFKVILMTYKTGVETFHLEKLPHTLYDGLLCVDADLEAEEYAGVVSVVASDMSTGELNDRIKRSNLFVYVKSGDGCTGGPIDLNQAPYIDLLPRLRKLTQTPLFVGFGIKSPADVATVIAHGADGAIIGTELLKTHQDQGMTGVVAYIESFIDNRVSQSLGS